MQRCVLMTVPALICTAVYRLLPCMKCCAPLCLQVHYILQEVVMGGMVLETNMNEIVAQVELQNRMEKSEVSFKGDLQSLFVSLTYKL